MMQPDDVFNHLSQVIIDFRKILPILVGIDGVDASGKTTFADKLAERLKETNRQIIRASIDGFHNPKSIRYRQGRNSPEGYYQDSFNLRLIINNLLKPLSFGNLEYREATFDYRTDKEVDLSDKKAEKDAILIMDGIFLYRPELLNFWDIKIFLDVGFDVTIQRAIKRAKEEETFDSEQDIIDIYNRRYIPGQKLYFQEAAPQENADILIDNSNYDSPVIMRTVFKSSQSILGESKPKQLRIALVQMFSEKGDIERNLVETARYIEEAEKRGTDIIAFPEASLSGYSDRGKFPEAVLSRDGPEVAAFLKLTDGKNLTVLAGIIENNPGMKPYVTHLVARKGELAGFYRKMNIIEEDAEFASAGDEVNVFEHDGLTFGMAVCSDISMETIFAECARMGATIVFEMAAPGLYGEQAERDWEAGYRWWEGECRKKLSAYAKAYGIWIAVATQAGRTTDEDFPGGGYLFSPKGERVYATKDWQPGVSYLEIDFDSGTVREID